MYIRFLRKNSDCYYNENNEFSIGKAKLLKEWTSEIIIESSIKTGAIVTAENHNVIGGLGSAVAEVLAENAPCISGSLILVCKAVYKPVLMKYVSNGANRGQRKIRTGRQ